MKEKDMKKLSLLLGSLITGPMIALAVPAMPGLTKLVQPDGSVVEATIKGDEHFHYYETAAGEILLRDNCGTLRPATITATGSLEAKGTITGMATPPQKRKAILEAVAGKHQKAAEAVWHPT